MSAGIALSLTPEQTRWLSIAAAQEIARGAVMLRNMTDDSMRSSIRSDMEAGMDVLRVLEAALGAPPAR